jgi:hypothetical protein
MDVLTEPTFDVPEELQALLTQKLHEKGSLRPIAKNIKVALTAAIAELRGLRPDSKSVLELNRFSDAHWSEIEALQIIYTYLESLGLRYSLGCLLEESGVEKKDHNLGIFEVVPRPDPDSPSRRQK